MHNRERQVYQIKVSLHRLDRLIPPVGNRLKVVDRNPLVLGFLRMGTNGEWIGHYSNGGIKIPTPLVLK